MGEVKVYGTIRVRLKRVSNRDTVEPPNKGHFGNTSFVLSSEVVPISEVHHILVLFHVIQVEKSFL